VAEVSRRRADESAQNLLEGTSGDSTSQPAFAASYTLILVACGAAGLAWKILSSSSTLPFPDAILALACISWFTAFLRVIRSPAALPATRLLSIVLVLWVPFGTAAFVYWLLRVRELER
jgi:hypothetical protein